MVCKKMFIIVLYILAVVLNIGNFFKNNAVQTLWTKAISEGGPGGLKFLQDVLFLTKYQNLNSIKLQ